MKLEKASSAFIAILLLISLTVFGQTKTEEQQRDKDFYSETNKWFSAWKLIWDKEYKLKKVKPVDFVLFDDQYVYTTSKITGEKAEPIAGPNLLNQKMQWYRKLHNNSLTMPDGEKAEVGMMCYASQAENGTAFFVMPLTSYWKKIGKNDHGIGIENLVICVFLHEFAHTQQIQSSTDGKLENYSKEHPDDAISDDIMQHYYEKDSAYVSSYNKELKLFQEAAFSTDKAERLEKTKMALSLLKARQSNCLQKENRDVAAMDNFFLTLEGVGQYNAFLWLTNEKGMNMTESDARKVMKTKWWSQEEGLDLVVLLSRFISKEELGKLMFGDKTENVVTLISNHLK